MHGDSTRRDRGETKIAKRKLGKQQAKRQRKQAVAYRRKQLKQEKADRKRGV